MEPSTLDDQPHAWLKEACNSAIRGDISKICASLGCDVNQSSYGLDYSLVCSPIRVQQVLEILFSSSSIDATAIHPQLALRAILLIPSSYEAPWLAVCYVIEKSFHQKMGCLGNLVAHDDKALLSLVTEIQSFFHQTVAVWWELERRLTSSHASKVNPVTITSEQLSNSTPRQMLVRLATIVMSPLCLPLDASDHFTKDNRRWTLPLELLATIISLFRDLEEPKDQSLVALILDIVFDERLQPICLLPWMTVVSDLRHNLRVSDWSRLRDRICRSLAIQQPGSMSIDVSDLPGLARAIVTLVSSNDDKESIDNEDVQKVWQQLILQLLSLASSNDATFSTLETVLQSSFAALPPQMLHKWLPQVTNTGESEGDEQSAVTDWIKVHLILLISQASGQSGSQLISDLVAKALGLQGESCHNISKQCWAKLVALAIPKPTSIVTSKGRQRHRIVVKNALQEVQRIFEKVSYNSQRQLVSNLQDNKEEIIPYLSQAATLLRESIFLGSISKRAQRPSYHIFFAERAQWWVHAANNAVLQPLGIDHRDGLSEYDMIMAIIVVVVVYCEIPTSRLSVVRSIQKSLSVDNKLETDETANVLYCTILATIVRSLNRYDNAASAAGLGALNSITNVFARHIPKSVFCPLAVALSPLPSARASLLSFARKCLDTAPWGCDYHFWLVDVESSDRRDRIECGFYALCTLLCSLGDECGLEAWKLLSDFVVLKRPSLPCAARSMLYGCLLGFAKRNRFNASFCEHLLRACLVTLCTYCSDSDGRLEIVPERAFSIWNDSKEASKIRTVQKEDLSSLMRLSCALLEIVSHSGEKQRQTFARARTSFLNNIVACKMVDCFAVSVFDDKENIGALGTISVIHSLIWNLLKDGASGAQDATSGGDQEPMSSTLVAKLLEAEREELNSLGLDWTSEDQVPAWLGEVSLTNGIRPPAMDAVVASVQLSFCDLLLEIVLNPCWPFENSDGEGQNEDGLRRTVTACGVLVSQKSKRRIIMATVDEVNSACALDNASFYSVAGSCLRLSAQFLDSVVPTQGALPDIETAFELALEVCESIQGVKVDRVMSERLRLDAQDLFRCVWELYTVVGTEAGSCRFIEHLEQTSAMPKGVSSLNTRLCFARVETTDDVDKIMRNIRTAILRALLHSMSMVSMNSQPVLSFELTYLSKEAPSVNFIDADFLSAALAVLCRDLRSGLDGRSGGVTSHSYLVYVDAIEVISDFIFDNIGAFEQMDSNSFLSACRQGSISIENILCSFPLRGAVLFKRSLRLALIQLPSLARSSGRVQSLGLMDSSSTTDGEFWTTHGFTNNVFGQCMSVLARWAHEGMNTTTPWFEIAGSEHCSTCVVEDVDFPAEQNTSDPLNPNSCDPIPAVIAIPDDRKSSGIPGTKSQNGVNKIQLPSKECWSWASVCALSAMEDIWMESLKVFSHKNAPNPSDWSTNNCANYLSVRREELGSVVQTLRLAFQHTEMAARSWLPVETKSKQGGFKMLLAICMPSAAKVRLCALLGRLSVVIRRSIKIVQAFIRDSPATTCNDDASTLAIETVEALSCLSAWLHDKCDDSDFTSLAKQWYWAEKKFQDASQKTNALPADGDDPVLRRFPKLLCRVDELESAAQTLHQMLGSLKDNDSRGKICALDAILKSSWEPSWDYDADDKATTIRSLLNKKVKAFASFAGNQLEEGPAKKPVSSRKKRSNDTQRMHRRHVKRSRNGLVDKWLQLDQEFEDECPDDDAYVELEDFLVDG